jgi:hypothetical protein
METGKNVRCQGYLWIIDPTPPHARRIGFGTLFALWKITTYANTIFNGIGFFSSLLAEMKVRGTQVDVNELEHLPPTFPTLRMIIRGRGLLHQQTWFAQSIYNVRDLN